VSKEDAASSVGVLPRTGSGNEALTLHEAVDAEVALARLPLAAATRRACVSKVRQFAAWLAVSDLDFGDPLADVDARNYAVRDFRSHLTRTDGRRRRP
jgi:hypothetical protein